MARRVDLAAALGKTTAADEPAGQETPAVTPAAKTTASKKSTSPRKKSSGAAPAISRKTAPPAPAAPAAEPIRVRVPASSGDAKRVNLYLEADDYRELRVASIDDGADLNSRFRALVALWRGNPRFRAQVDQLARSAPRGGSY